MFRLVAPAVSAGRVNPEMVSSTNTKLLLGALCLLGFVVVIVSTPWGIGLSPDSIAYIAGARSLANGQGFGRATWDGGIEPITHRPPLYSIALAGPGIVGIDPLLSAPWIGGLLLAANVYIAGHIVGSGQDARSPGTRLFAAVGAGLVLASPTILELHVMAWSEPLFMALGFAGLLLLGKFVDGRGPRYLLAASLLTALTCLTRYIGIAFVMAGLAALLLLDRSAPAKRAGHLLAFSALGSLPLCAWLLRNRVLAGAATNREIVFHPPSLDHLRLGLNTVAGWLLIPETASGLLKLALIALVIGLIAVSVVAQWRNKRRGGLSSVTRGLALFVPIYLGLLVASITFVDANTPLNGRILSPVFMAGIGLALPALAWWYANWSKTSLRVGLVGGVLLLGGLYLPGSWRLVRQGRTDGLGFNSTRTYSSQTIRLVAELPAGIPIYSNSPEAIYIRTGRPAERLPSRNSSVTLTANPAYFSEMAKMESDVVRHNGVIVFFDALQRANYPSMAELIDDLGYQIIHQAADGALLDKDPQ